LPNGAVELEDGRRLLSGRIINAAGPWSPLLSPGIPIRKRKGHLVITRGVPHLTRSQVVELGYARSTHHQDEDSVACNVQPRQNGELIIGASRQYQDSNVVDEAIVRKMVDRAVSYLPKLAGVDTSKVRIGHRAATPDSLPLIGPSSSDSRIWLATGHEG